MPHFRSREAPHHIARDAAPVVCRPALADRIVSLYLGGQPASRIASNLGLQVKQVNALLDEGALSA